MVEEEEEEEAGEEEVGVCHSRVIVHMNVDRLISLMECSIDSVSSS